MVSNSCPATLEEYKEMVGEKRLGRGGKRTYKRKRGRTQRLRPTVAKASTLAVLKALGEKDLRPALRNCVIDSMTSGEMKALREVAVNFLSKNIPVKQSELLKLGRYKNTLRNLANTPVLEKNKKALKQKGGILPFFIPLIVGAAAAAAKGAIAGGVAKAVRKS